MQRKLNIKGETLLGPHGYTNEMDQSMGLLTPLSFVPHPLLPYTDNMSFRQRAYNALLTAYESFFRRFSYISSQNKLARKYFRDGIEGDIPHVVKMERDTSVMLVNYHSSLGLPRPTMPGQINIAGAHIRPPLRLPNDFIVR